MTNIICKGAEDKLASNIEIIDTRKISSVCNYLIVCSANSKPHFDAIVDGIEAEIKKRGLKMPKPQGEKESNWIILDFINVIVHILGKEERQKYNLEELWGKSGIIYHL